MSWKQFRLFGSLSGWVESTNVCESPSHCFSLGTRWHTFRMSPWHARLYLLRWCLYGANCSEQYYSTQAVAMWLAMAIL